MLDFFMNVQEASGGGGALPDDYTYNQNARKAPAPTHLLTVPTFQGVQSEIRIYDITSLPTITQTAAFNPSGYTNYLQNIHNTGHHGAVKDGYFYYVTYGNELHVYDVTNPSLVSGASKIYDSGGSGPLYGTIIGVFAHPTKDILWVLNSQSTPSLTTLDISNPASPSIISTITPYGDPDAPAISRDGERLFYKTTSQLVSYGLDASGNPSGFQADPISGPAGGSFPATANLRGFSRMEFVQTGSGNNYIVGGYGSHFDIHYVIKLGADHIPDAFAYQETDVNYSDKVNLVFPFPWAESSFSDDLVYFKTEIDDTELQVSTFDPSTNTFSHHGSVVDTTWVGNSGTQPLAGIEGWNEYAVVIRMNGYIGFWEYDPVGNSWTRIAGLTRSTTPDVHDWGAGQNWLFAVP